MSGGACVVIIAEALKMKAPSPDLEKCLRATLQNPLVVERVNMHPEGPYIYEEYGPMRQWGKDEQKRVQDLLREIVEADLGIKVECD